MVSIHEFCCLTTEAGVDSVQQNLHGEMTQSRGKWEVAEIGARYVLGHVCKSIYTSIYVYVYACVPLPLLYSYCLELDFLPGPDSARGFWKPWR